MDPDRSLWIPMDPYDSLWIPMDPYGSRWIPMDPYGSRWIPMDPHGSPWIPMDPHGSPWIQMDPHGSLWISMDPYRSRWIRMADLEIVRRVSGNFNICAEKFLRNGRLYWDKNASFCAKTFHMMGNCSKKQNNLCIPAQEIVAVRNMSHKLICS